MEENKTKKNHWTSAKVDNAKMILSKIETNVENVGAGIVPAHFKTK